MTVQALRLLVKLFRIDALVNRDKFNTPIEFEWRLKNGKRLSIDFYPLWDISSFISYIDHKEEDGRVYKSTTFILYRKIMEDSKRCKYNTIELPWLYIHYE